MALLSILVQISSFFSLRSFADPIRNDTFPNFSFPLEVLLDDFDKTEMTPMPVSLISADFMLRNFFSFTDANVGILGAHAAQNAAKLAVEGDFGQAQINALVTQKLVERHA